MKMEMKTAVLALWGPLGQGNQGGGTFRGVERGRLPLGPFSCCTCGMDRATCLTEASGLSTTY